MIYSLESVSKFFQQRHEQVPALNGVSLQIKRGEIVALLGQSGAGKTTLFRLLNGTLRPTQGVLLFTGRDTKQMSSSDLRGMRRGIGTIYQQHNLVPSLTVLENTLCGALGRMSFWETTRGLFQPARQDLEQALHALELVGLADKTASRAHELSGGQQQRLAVARVLMQSPEVILADEPTASLDPALAEDVTSLLIKLAGEGKRTLIMAVHRVDLALRHFARVVAMRQGCVAFDASSSNVDPAWLDALYTRDPRTATASENRQPGNQFGCAR